MFINIARANKKGKRDSISKRKKKGLEAVNIDNEIIGKIQDLQKE